MLEEQGQHNPKEPTVFNSVPVLISTSKPPESTPLKLKNFNDLLMSPEIQQPLLMVHTKECTICKNTLNEQDSCYLQWQRMYFCDTVCLHWYQREHLIEGCSNCFKTISEDQIGKFVFRFDQLLQFCSVPCFHEYQIKRKSCLYCMGKILSFAVRLDEHNAKYCTKDCEIKHAQALSAYPIVSLSERACCVCKSELHPITIQFQLASQLKNICNPFCLQTFSFVHRVKPVQCCSCKNFFEESLKGATITQNGSSYLFCSKKCESYFTFSNMKVFACSYCNTKRFDADLIKRHSKIEPTVYICCVECYLRKFAAGVTVKRAPLIQRPPLLSIENTLIEMPSIMSNGALSEPASNSNNYPTELKTCFIVKPSSLPDQKNIATMCYVQKNDKTTTVQPEMLDQMVQTDYDPPKKILIPIPVPIYVAAPMHMFSVPLPSPVPFPVPLPVPVFIPTTKRCAKRIFNDIKTRIDAVPSNAFEAELLDMADMLTKDSSKNVSTESDAMLPDLDVGEMFGDNMLEMALKMANEIEGDCDSDDLGLKQDKVELKESKKLSVVNLSKSFEVQADKDRLETRLGVHAWRQWIKTTKSLDLFNPRTADILQFPTEELSKCLALFVSEVKRPNGKDYAPDTMLYLCLSIQKHLHENQRVDNIFFDAFFKEFTERLDELMKMFPLMFLDSSFIVTRVEEGHLWSSGQLGAHSPHVLLNTILYHNMKYFKLLTVGENLALLISSLHKKVSKNGKKTSIIRHCDGKKVLKMPSKANKERCPVILFDFYCSKLPGSSNNRCGGCYYEPEPSSIGESPVWYSSSPLNERELEKMVNRLRIVKELNVSLTESDEELSRNSDPQALPLAVATMQGCQLLGMPEADVLLAQCAIYLARAPKSREADSALARAKYLIKDCKGSQPAVPMHLRNAPTKLMKDLGYGELQEEEFSFMPPEYKDVNFFD